MSYQKTEDTDKSARPRSLIAIRSPFTESIIRDTPLDILGVWEGVSGYNSSKKENLI